jgi:hypothetical protein
LIFFDYFSGKFMQRILATPRCLSMHGLEGYPPERASASTTFPPPQSGFIELLAPVGKFRIHALDRIRPDVLKVRSGARGELIQVKPAEPARGSYERAGSLVTDLVRVVPDLVDFGRGRIEPGIALALYLQTQGANATEGSASHHKTLADLPSGGKPNIYPFRIETRRATERDMNRSAFAPGGSASRRYATAAGGSRRL